MGLLKHGEGGTHHVAGTSLKKPPSREYRAWSSARNRCLSKNNPVYLRYGGKGITFCKRWNSYNKFLADMGRCPKGLTLERIDNLKGYSPKNCKWATRTAQQRNRSNTVCVQFKGKTVLLVDLAAKTGLDYHFLYDRIFRYGKWSAERAVSTPKGGYHHSVK